MFREPVDTDTKRKEVTWIAILFLVALASWQIIASYLGKAADFSPRSYEDKVLFAGMGVILLCSVLYIAIREREERHANQRLLASLTEAVGALNERLRQLRSLCITSADFVGTLDANHVCQLAVDALYTQLRAEACTLTLTTACRGTQTFSAGNTSVLSINDTPADGSIHEMSTPVLVGDKAVGRILAIRRGDAADFSPEETSILVTLANMTSKALETTTLHENLQENYLSTLGALMNLLGARDNYAAAHARRVSNLSVRFAQYLGLSEEEIGTLEEYSLLHDLGKIGIPDEILLKPSPLTDAERSICEQHPIVGEQILRPLRPSALSLSIIRSHHERWDGAGYPDGLEGEAVPVLARLVHICDAYDAILSERPYAPSCEPQSALTEIQLGSGTQFDPELVKSFVTMITEECRVTSMEYTSGFMQQPEFSSC